MINKSAIYVTAAALVLLAGCGGSGSGVGSNPNPSPDPNAGAVDAVFGGDVTGASTSISDADTLSRGLEAAFGGENDAPVSVNPGDTISDVLDRARNG